MEYTIIIFFKVVINKFYKQVFYTYFINNNNIVASTMPQAPSQDVSLGIHVLNRPGRNKGTLQRYYDSTLRSIH